MTVATVIAMGNDKSMTKDEQRRLTIVEQKQDATDKNITEIKNIVTELRDAYQRGKGAYWAFIKIGVIATALISLTSAIINYLPMWIKH